MPKTRRVRCPYCGFLDVIKWGKQCGYQRYKCKNCDILFIDDAGVEKEKYLCYGNPITPVADIIDHRYIRRKKTIFTTNLVPAELCSRYGERIADRMNEDYAFIMYSNHPSYR